MGCYDRGRAKGDGAKVTEPNLRFSARTSSVTFFDFSQGNLENLVGNLEGILRDFF